MNSEKNRDKWLSKVKDTLKIGGRSERTFNNYKSCINRFLNYYNEETVIKSLKEEDIVDYINKKFLSKDASGETINLNICAIRFLFSICFNKELNKKLLPSSKLQKRIPSIISKKDFLNIYNNEKSLKHKCWLLLAFCSGLRVEEIATIKIENIDSTNHRLKVLGKGNKERYTILPDCLINVLRNYYVSKNLNSKTGYLFNGTNNKEHLNSKTIINWFTLIKKAYNLPDNITFHSLRHSFATYFLMNGGNIYDLKCMLGHKSFGSVSIYLHISQDFNKLKGIKYE